MTAIRRNTRGALVLAFLSLAVPFRAAADSCPTPDEIRERGISRDYEWTLDEGVDLEALLGVSGLVRASVENFGEFVVCTYVDGEQELNLYALPGGDNCFIDKAGGRWSVAPGGRLQCADPDPLQCAYRVDCGDAADDQ